MRVRGGSSHHGYSSSWLSAAQRRRSAADTHLFSDAQIRGDLCVYELINLVVKSRRKSKAWVTTKTEEYSLCFPPPVNYYIELT